MEKVMSKDPHCSSPIVNEIDWEFVENNSRSYTYRSAYGMSIATVYDISGAGALLVVHPEDRQLVFSEDYVPEAFAYARRLKEQYRFLRG